VVKNAKSNRTLQARPWESGIAEGGKAGQIIDPDFRNVLLIGEVAKLRLYLGARELEWQRMKFVSQTQDFSRGCMVRRRAGSEGTMKET